MRTTCDKLTDIVNDLNIHLNNNNYPYHIICNNNLTGNIDQIDPTCFDNVPACGFTKNEYIDTQSCSKISAIHTYSNKEVANVTFTVELMKKLKIYVIDMGYFCTNTDHRRKGLIQFLIACVFKFAIQDGRISYIISDTNEQSGPLLEHKFKFLKDNDDIEVISDTFGIGNTIRPIELSNPEKNDPMDFFKLFDISPPNYDEFKKIVREYFIGNTKYFKDFNGGSNRRRSKRRSNRRSKRRSNRRSKRRSKRK